MIGVLLNGAACALNVYIYLAVGHNPINLAVAVFCGLMALAFAAEDR